MEGTERPARLSLARVVGQVGRIYIERWAILVGAGLLIFVPVSLIEVADEWLQEPLADTGSGAGGAQVAAAIASAAVHGMSSLFGEVLYAGLVTVAVLAYREGRRISVGEVARSLPYARLIGADLLLVAAIGLGLLALVVPGLVLLTWFALVAPVIEVEGAGAVASFRRSRELVRGNGWRVFALVLPVLLAQDAIAEGAHTWVSGVLGEAFGGAWAAAIGANLIAAPFFALVVVVIYFELSSQPSGAQPSPRTPPRSSHRGRSASSP